jgi:hypothetical protein
MRTVFLQSKEKHQRLKHCYLVSGAVDYSPILARRGGLRT